MAVCPICHETVDKALGAHVRRRHTDELERVVLAAKQTGMPDVEIGRRFGISYRYLEHVITKHYGANVSHVSGPKPIKTWQPKDFTPESTTVWSFRQRGSWATHDGRYRGNWSPFIPRNLMTRYTQPGELVLDYFVGGGTTAVEAKLLGRRMIGRDINAEAIAIAKTNVNFDPPPASKGDLCVFEPQLEVGDARELGGIADNSVDMICAHPPYAGIIDYSTDNPCDLSQMSLDDFLLSMADVAKESLRVLKPGGICAILIGDGRKAKHVVPMGFRTIEVFLRAGFCLQDLVIKRQHNCKSTGFWYANSIKYNFLLLAHEYLPVFQKPRLALLEPSQLAFWGGELPRRVTLAAAPMAPQSNGCETTTVWIFPQSDLDAEVRRNLLSRFAPPGAPVVDVTIGGQPDNCVCSPTNALPIVHFDAASRVGAASDVARYQEALTRYVESLAADTTTGSFVAVTVCDVKAGATVYPLGVAAFQALSNLRTVSLREIVIVTVQEPPNEQGGSDLSITHRYVLVYEIARA